MRARLLLLSCRAIFGLLQFRLGSVALLSIFAHDQAHAGPVSRACQPTDSPFVCRLRSLLMLLDTAAALLSFLLGLALVTAFWAYRRNSRKLSPEEITHDAS